MPVLAFDALQGLTHTFLTWPSMGSTVRLQSITHPVDTFRPRKFLFFVSIHVSYIRNVSMPTHFG
jgi:hypothetical protein